MNVIVLNLREQPLELHLPQRVVLIEPLGEVEISDAEANAGSVVTLAAREALRILQPSSKEPRPSTADQTPVVKPAGKAKGRAETPSLRNRREIK